MTFLLVSRLTSSLTLFLQVFSYKEMKLAATRDLGRGRDSFGLGESSPTRSQTNRRVASNAVGDCFTEDGPAVCDSTEGGPAIGDSADDGPAVGDSAEDGPAVGDTEMPFQLVSPCRVQ